MSSTDEELVDYFKDENEYESEEAVLNSDVESEEELPMHLKVALLQKEEDEEEEQVEGWGQSRATYYGADEEEYDPQIVQELEKKQVFDESVYEDTFESLLKTKKSLPESKKDEKMLKKLVHERLPSLKKWIAEWASTQELESDDKVAMLVKYMYMTNLSFYFSVVGRNNHQAKVVEERLEEWKEILDTMMNMGFADSDVESEVEDVVSGDELSEQVESRDEEQIEEQSEDEEQVEEEEEEEVFPEYAPLVPKKQKSKMDTFGETQIDDLDEKLARKKSLKFHVKRVDTALNRGGYVKSLLTGMMREEEKKPVKVQDGDDLEMDMERPNDMESIDMDMEMPNDMESDVDPETIQEYDSDIEYYNSVKQAKEESKKRKAEVQVFGDEELMPVEGKRAATYKILSNKGLTPKRKKIDRNPRVKKKIKYQKAISKLKSVKRVAVDKSKVLGGGTGTYAGETTGIKRGLVKSIKF